MQVTADPLFLSMLAASRRQAILKGKGKPKMPNFPKPVWRYPVLLDRKYQNYLLALFRPLAAVGKAWAKEYPSILREYQGKQDANDLHQDATSQELTFRLRQDLEKTQESMDLGPMGAVESTIYGTGDAMAEWNKKRWALERELALGYVYDPAEPWVAEALDEWTQTNLRLVKSLSGEYLVRMETLALEALQVGKRPEDLLVDILRLNKNLTVNRARLIATDQLGKLNGLMTERRSLACGMDTFEWLSAADERVRPSHVAANRKIGTYSNSSIWVVHGEPVPRNGEGDDSFPGLPIRCFFGEQIPFSPFKAEVLYRHLYSGKTVTLISETGESFRSTFNHPVLRADGVMVPAHKLNRGDKVVKICKEGFATLDDNDKDRMTFEELYQFCSSVLVTLRMPSTSEDFHSDGSAHDVDVIDLKGPLSNSWEACITEGTAKIILTEAYMGLVSEPTKNNSIPISTAMLDPSDSIVCCLREFQTLISSSVGHAQVHRLRSPTWLDTMLEANTSDDVAAYVETLRDREFALSGAVSQAEIFFRDVVDLVLRLWDRETQTKLTHTASKGPYSDTKFAANTLYRLTGEDSLMDIADIVLEEFSGHVYNLQTEVGWYSIRTSAYNYNIVSNCRCVGAARWEDLLKPIDESLLMDPYVQAELKAMGI
jgi:hypothetical protein